MMLFRREIVDCDWAMVRDVEGLGCLVQAPTYSYKLLFGPQTDRTL